MWIEREENEGRQGDERRGQVARGGGIDGGEVKGTERRKLAVLMINDCECL